MQRGGALAADGRRPYASPGMPRVARAVTRSRAGLGGVHVYYEPGAILPDELKQTPIGHETRAIVTSFFDRPFVILPGPLFRL